MKREPFDKELEKLLRDKAESVKMEKASEEKMFCRILEQTGQTQKKEDLVMLRRFTKRKVVAAAAALCLIGAFGAAAAGKIVTVSSSVQVDQPDYRSAAELSQAADQLGFTPKAPESFSNGYQFSNGYFVMLEGADENQNAVAEYPSVMADYQKGDDSVVLSIEVPMDDIEQGGPAELTSEYNGVTLNYFHTDSLFVGMDYELTQEEQDLLNKGELNVGYGEPGMTRQEVTNLFVTWTDQGGNYSLMAAQDSDLTSEDLFAMAREIIDCGD